MYGSYHKKNLFLIAQMLLNRVWFFCNSPGAHQAPLFMGIKPGDWTFVSGVSCTGRWIFGHRVTRGAHRTRSNLKFNFNPFPWTFLDNLKYIYIFKVQRGVVEKSGREHLHQVYGVNISSNGINWYQHSPKNTITADIIAQKNKSIAT